MSLNRFLDTVYHSVPGEHVRWDEFLADFYVFLRDRNKDPGKWPAERVHKELRFSGLPIGRGPANQKIIGNVSKVRCRPRKFVQAGNNVRLEP